MTQLLLPSDDRAVFIQLIVVVTVAVAAWVASKRRREWRLVTVGSLLLAIAAMALRAVH